MQAALIDSRIGLNIRFVRYVQVLADTLKQVKMDLGQTING